MYSEENKGGMGMCPKCGGMCGGRCGGGMEGKAMMWMHMPKEMKVAKLEKKKAIMQAELAFIDKMIEMVKKMPEEKK